jgi:hypothetical protein
MKEICWHYVIKFTIKVGKKKKGTMCSKSKSLTPNRALSRKLKYPIGKLAGSAIGVAPSTLRTSTIDVQTVVF